MPSQLGWHRAGLALAGVGTLFSFIGLTSTSEGLAEGYLWRDGASTGLAARNWWFGWSGLETSFADDTPYTQCTARLCGAGYNDDPDDRSMVLAGEGFFGMTAVAFACGLAAASGALGRFFQLREPDRAPADATCAAASRFWARSVPLALAACCTNTLAWVAFIVGMYSSAWEESIVGEWWPATNLWLQFANTFLYAGAAVCFGRSGAAQQAQSVPMLEGLPK